jgi:heme-degrading monooxygenase HmoA
MVGRMWRGVTRADDAERYAAYIERTGLREYRATPGNRGAWLLHRVDGDHAEFLTISLWDSVESIRAFAGDDVEQAVFYPEDDAFLVERDVVASHWHVTEPPGGDAPDRTDSLDR